MERPLVSRKPGRVIGLVAVPLLAAMLAATVFGAAAGADSHKANSSSAAGAKGSALLQAVSAPVHGVAEDGTEFNGDFVLKRFQAKDGALYAVGHISGVLGEKNVRKHVSLPVTGGTSVQNPAEGATAEAITAQQIVPTPGACDILTLALGPLDLDLLGLRIALDEVNLLIEAIPGAGNLLGNLLCSVAGLLDPGGVGGLSGLLQGLLDAVSNLLNGLLGGL